MIILDQIEMEIPYDDHESFPENWPEDPLLLLGWYLTILELSETEANEFRLSAAAFGESNGAEWLWANRMRLAAEIEFIRRF